MDSAASGGVGPDELVEGDIRGADLNLGDPRLRGADPLAELLLGEAVRLALPTNGESQRESKPGIGSLPMPCLMTASQTETALRKTSFAVS